MMQADELKRLLVQRLGRRYTEGLWNLLVADGNVDEVVDHGARFEAFLERAEVLLSHLQPPKVRSVSTPTEAPSPALARERAAVLSDLVTEHARKDPDVVRFRKKHLKYGLVTWTDLEDWLRENAASDSAKTLDITISVPTANMPDTPRKAIDLAPHLATARICNWAARSLDYAVPGEGWVRRMVVSDGSVLDSLRVLSDSLAKSFSWQPAQATVFVLTDTIAYIDPIRVTGPSENVRHNVDLGWARRITLDVDPALGPDEVAATYQRIRERNGLNRIRPLSAKHLRLASFTGADHAQRRWQERFELWNRLYPEWRYNASSNFRRDAIRAQYRILYPGRHRGSAPIRRS